MSKSFYTVVHAAVWVLTLGFIFICLVFRPRGNFPLLQKLLHGVLIPKSVNREFSFEELVIMADDYVGKGWTMRMSVSENIYSKARTIEFYLENSIGGSYGSIAVFEAPL
jgi:hypothetical protein